MNKYLHATTIFHVFWTTPNIFGMQFVAAMISDHIWQFDSLILDRVLNFVTHQSSQEENNSITIYATEFNSRQQLFFNLFAASHNFYLPVMSSNSGILSTIYSHLEHSFDSNKGARKSILQTKFSDVFDCWCRDFGLAHFLAWMQSTVQTSNKHIDLSSQYTGTLHAVRHPRRLKRVSRPFLVLTGLSGIYDRVVVRRVGVKWIGKSVFDLWEAYTFYN